MRMLLMTAVASLAAGALGYVAAAVWTVLLARYARGGDAFLRRLLPLAGLLAGALVLMAPAFLLHEPAQADERPGLVASALAAFGLLLLGATVARAVRAFLATRRLVAEWSRDAQEIALPGQPAPAFGIAHSFPVVAVVGVWRPRLFIARPVLQALTPDELQAVVAHEAWHVRAGDNLKRWLMACAPDALRWTPIHREITAAWHHAAEDAADDIATARDDRARVDLAALLLKIARLTPEPRWPAATVSPFVEVDGLDRRVRRLLDSHRASASPRWAAVPLIASAVLVAAALAAVSSPAALKTVFDFVEAIVTFAR